ncbi:hypothetical protein B0H11DRAFT_1980050 [Mycena galericulata]|nr:hypothetical protein B0H11DRAFT_1980050 [Mycena galericulata]
MAPLNGATPNCKSGRLAAIDIELESIYERIAMLKAERNALAPISCLPNELLAHIFGVCADDASSSISPMEWTSVLLVCRHWNELALASPTLWGHIHFLWEPSERRLLAQLERSGAVPLTIKIGFLHSDDYAQRILSNAQRIESLDIGGEIGDAVDFMGRMSHHEFPLLHSLSLRPRDDQLDDNPELHPTLPSELLDGAPRLTELALSYIDAPWRSFSSLQSLSLVGHPLSLSTHIPLEDLFAVLKSSPQLNTLKLDIAVHPDRPDREYEALSLPLLEHLYLRELLSLCEDLLRHLVFPPTARLELYPQGITMGTNIRDILVPVRKHLRATGAPVPRVLSIRIPRRAPDDGNFYAAVYLDPTRPARLGEDVFFGINTHPANAPGLRQIITKVLKTLPTDAITHLDATAAHATARTWKTVLALLPALQVITVSVTDAGKALCEALIEAPTSIRMLRLHAFIRRGPEDEEEVVALFFDMLTRLLNAYDACGTPLERLQVKDYLNSLEVSDTKWAELGGLVGELVREGFGH